MKIWKRVYLNTRTPPTLVRLQPHNFLRLQNVSSAGCGNRCGVTSKERRYEIGDFHLLTNQEGNLRGVRRRARLHPRQQIPSFGAVSVAHATTPRFKTISYCTLSKVTLFYHDTAHHKHRRNPRARRHVNKLSYCRTARAVRRDVDAFSHSACTAVRTV